MHGLLVGLALCYVLFKIPSWVLKSTRGGGGTSFLGSAIRGVVTYKSLGLLRAGAQSVASWRMPRTAGKGEKRPSDPYAHAEMTEQGQWMLPLGPLTRTRPRGRRHTTPQTEATGGAQTTRRGRDADGARSAGKSGRARSGPRDATPGSRSTAQGSASRDSAHGSRSHRSASRSGSRGSGPSGRQGRLFTPDGTANAAAVPERHPGGLPVWQRPGEQRMLPIITAHEPNRTGRETLSDEHARREPNPAPVSGRQTAMFQPQSGELNRQALPPHRRPAAVGEQQHLELEPRGMPKPAQGHRPARFNNQPARESGRPVPSQPGSSPPVSRHQMPLLHRDGSPTRQSQAVPGAEQRTHATQQARQAREARRARAQARNHRRRGATAAPVPEFLAPRPVSTGPTNPPPAPSPASGDDPGRGRSASSDDQGRESADE